MSKKYKIFMAAGSNGYARWFPFDYKIVADPSLANVVWFEGGADLSCWAYNAKSGSHTYASDSLTKRYVSVWNYFKDKRALKIGSCLGHQALCCFNFPNKVKLSQHIDHPYHHPVITKEGKELISNSLHHQIPILDEKITGLKEGKDYELVLHSNKLSPFHLDENDNDYNFPEDHKEVEGVWIEKSLSFSTQNHLEMMDENSPLVEYCQKTLIEKMKAAGI